MLLLQGFYSVHFSSMSDSSEILLVVNCAVILHSVHCGNYIFPVSCCMFKTEAHSWDGILSIYPHTNAASHTPLLDMHSLGLHLRQTYPDSQQYAFFLPGSLNLAYLSSAAWEGLSRSVQIILGSPTIIVDAGISTLTGYTLQQAYYQGWSQSNGKTKE